MAKNNNRLSSNKSVVLQESVRKRFEKGLDQSCQHFIMFNFNLKVKQNGLPFQRRGARTPLYIKFKILNKYLKILGWSMPFG